MYFSRCCYCIPLRIGLLTWGYVKLILLIWFIGAILLDDINNKGRYVPPIEYAITLIVVLLGMVDVIFTIVFIFACHKKNRKLLQIYNGYTIAYLFLAALVLIGWVMEQLLDTTPNKPTAIPTDLIINAVTAIVHILWSSYMALVVGSEIRNLDTRGEVLFVSHGRKYYYNTAQTEIVDL